MVPNPGHRVVGVLYRDLPDSAWPRLDAFEGEMYMREHVQVHTQDGTVEPAWTYVFVPAYTHRLAPGDWDPEAFTQQGKARFEARYLGFDALLNPTDSAVTP